MIKRAREGEKAKLISMIHLNCYIHGKWRYRFLWGKKKMFWEMSPIFNFLSFKEMSFDRRLASCLSSHQCSNECGYKDPYNCTTVLEQDDSSDTLNRNSVLLLCKRKQWCRLCDTEIRTLPSSLPLMHWKHLTHSSLTGLGRVLSSNHQRAFQSNDRTFAS